MIEREIEQAHPHSQWLCGDERLKELRSDLRRDARSAIGHRYFDKSRLRSRCRSTSSRRSGLIHRFDRVPDQIEQDLLDLHLVRQHEIGGRVDLKRDAHALLLGAHQRERAGLLDQLLQAFHAALGFAAATKSRKRRMICPARSALSAALFDGVADHAPSFASVLPSRSRRDPFM